MTLVYCTYLPSPRSTRPLNKFEGQSYAVSSAHYSHQSATKDVATVTIRRLRTSVERITMTSSRSNLTPDRRLLCSFSDSPPLLPPPEQLHQAHPVPDSLSALV